jgi:hypothetical protein
MIYSSWHHFQVVKPIRIYHQLGGRGASETTWGSFVTTTNWHSSTQDPQDGIVCIVQQGVEEDNNRLSRQIVVGFWLNSPSYGMTYIGQTPAMQLRIFGTSTSYASIHCTHLPPFCRVNITLSNTGFYSTGLGRDDVTKITYMIPVQAWVILFENYPDMIF